MNNDILNLIIIIGVFAVIGIGMLIMYICETKQNTIFDNMLANNKDYQNLLSQQKDLWHNYLEAKKLRENIEEKEKELKYFPNNYMDRELQKMKIDFQILSADYYNYLAIQAQTHELYKYIRCQAYEPNKL